MSAPESSPEERQVPLREYLAVLRLRKWGIVAITLLTIGVTLLFSFRQTPIYDSETQVLVTPVPTSGTTPTTPVLNLDTERTIATSLEVAEIAAERLGGALDPIRLLEELEVTVETNTEVLTFTYSDPSPLEAQRRAQAFADAYLDFRREKALDSLLAASESIEERAQQLERDLARTNRRILATTDESERANLQAQASSLVAQIAVLEGQVSELAPTQQLQVGEIIAPASLPSTPASPNHILNGALALLIGLALGVGFAFLRERLDDRLRGQADLEARSGAPVLAVVPRIPNWKKIEQTPLIVVSDPRSGAAEAYKTLRTSLLFAAAERGVKSVLMASPQPGEGKTATSANLAVALGQAGRRVIVVSADLRKPRLHKFFGLENRAGLSSLLTGDSELIDVILDPGLPNVRVIPSGPVPKNSAELLGSHAMHAVIEELERYADLVLIDSPPVLNLADAMTLAPLVDAVVLLADAEKTSGSAVTHARRQLEQVRADVIGSVLNNLDPTKGRAYYYAYYPYYRYQYKYYEEPGHAASGRERRSTGAVPLNGPSQGRAPIPPARAATPPRARRQPVNRESRSVRGTSAERPPDEGFDELFDAFRGLGDAVADEPPLSPPRTAEEERRPRE